MDELILKLDNVSKSFNKLKVLDGVTCDIKKGDVVGLIGPSGGGKSVLLKVIAQVLSPDKGSIDYCGLKPEQIGLMFQEGALFDSLNVFDNVAFPLVDGNVPSSSLPEKKQLELSEKVLEVLSRVGLKEAYKKYPAQLSGGMKRRVSLARTLVDKPELALLDDPTCGLDPVASNVIMNLIMEIQKEMHASMIIASQDLRRLIPYVDKIIALFDGKIAYYGVCRPDLLDPHEDVTEFISCRFDLNTLAAA